MILKSPSANIRDFWKKGKIHVEGKGAAVAEGYADRARGVTYDGHVQFDLLTLEAVGRRMGAKCIWGKNNTIYT